MALDSDGAPCCMAYVTSRGNDHEPGCPDPNDQWTGPEEPDESTEYRGPGCGPGCGC